MTASPTGGSLRSDAHLGFVPTGKGNNHATILGKSSPLRGLSFKGFRNADGLPGLYMRWITSARPQFLRQEYIHPRVGRGLSVEKQVLLGQPSDPLGPLQFLQALSLVDLQ